MRIRGLVALQTYDGDVATGGKGLLRGDRAVSGGDELCPGEVMSKVTPQTALPPRVEVEIYLINQNDRTFAQWVSTFRI